ncbi:MAG: hypothetical protein KME30_26535 [Iphinoe sp. HA4291-MV1]|nr:hypothetical protein [Iphinoe sp. HA4291-MV1]
MEPEDEATDTTKTDLVAIERIPVARFALSQVPKAVANTEDKGITQQTITPGIIPNPVVKPLFYIACTGTEKSCCKSVAAGIRRASRSRRGATSRSSLSLGLRRTYAQIQNYKFKIQN